MSVRKILQVSSPIALAVMVASCGGGTAGNTTGNAASSATEPEVGAANETIDPQQASGSPISGRVADGYIQGATVCVDLDNSDTCEEDEPSTITGVGGSYDLTVPAGAEDKPIVAAIPAEAIDEDTGEPIGKSLVFVAPADKPEFVSPITTLIHQELRSNPALNTEEAESAVKTLLGVSEEEDVSLFTDYVASGVNANEDGDTTEQDRYRYLHDTARVVTSMMKDIGTQVEAAAQSTGVDVSGSVDTQRAIRDIVRSEVRELLPQIASQVAAIVIAEQSSGSEAGDSDAGAARFNPQQIAESLRPVDVVENVQERIDAVVDRVEPVQADIKVLLGQGMYWMEFDCYHEADTDEYIEELAPSDTVKLHDHEQASRCYPFYGKVQLNDAGDELVSQNFSFDPDSGAWTEEMLEESDDADFVLVDGQWEQYTSSGPQGVIEFDADGTAVLENAEGVMQLKAVTQTLDALPVKKHLLSDDIDPAWFGRITDEDLFNAGAEAHKVSVTQTLNPYIMYNEQANDDQDAATGLSFCAAYANNCNVAGSGFEDQFYAFSSLTDVREAALQGVELSSDRSYLAAQYGSMTLRSDELADGSLPKAGIVEWRDQHGGISEPNYSQEFARPDSLIDGTYPADQPVYVDSCFAPEVYPSELKPGEGDPDYPGKPEPEEILEPGTDFGQIDSPDFPEEPELVFPPEFSVSEESTDTPKDTDEEPAPLLAQDDCVDIAAQNGPDKEYVDPLKLPYPETLPAISQWRLINVDGVEMIEIDLPEKYRYDDSDSGQAILLVEHTGVVRFGARLPVTYIDRVVTYNESAFVTMRAIAERLSDK